MSESEQVENERQKRSKSRVMIMSWKLEYTQHTTQISRQLDDNDKKRTRRRKKRVTTRAQKNQKKIEQFDFDAKK